MKRVVVTGLGAVTPVGNDVESTWQSLLAGRSGIVTISTFDPASFNVRIAGLVKDFELSTHLDGEQLELAHDLSRAGSFGVASAAQAIADAGIQNGPYEPHECGLAFGSSVGRPELKHLADMLYPISEHLDLYRQPPSMVYERDPNLAMNVIAELGRCNGPMINVSTACTASAHAIGEAFRRIQEDEAKLMLVGGFDALTTWLDVLGFSLLGALTDEYNDDPTHASRPFAADRSGFVLGEGAITAVLEDREAALARGARSTARSSATAPASTPIASPTPRPTAAARSSRWRALCTRPGSAPTRSTMSPRTAPARRATTSARRSRSRRSSATSLQARRSARRSR